MPDAWNSAISFNKPEPAHTCAHAYGSDFQKEFDTEEEYEETGFYQNELNEQINNANIKLTEQAVLVNDALKTMQRRGDQNEIINLMNIKKSKTKPETV